LLQSIKIQNITTSNSSENGSGHSGQYVC